MYKYKFNAAKWNKVYEENLPSVIVESYHDLTEEVFTGKIISISEGGEGFDMVVGQESDDFLSRFFEKHG